MANEVPAPEAPKPIEHYIGAAVVTALQAIDDVAPMVVALPKEAQTAFVNHVIQETAKIAGETVRAHYAEGKVEL